MSERYRNLWSTTGRQVNESAIRRMGITAARVPNLVSFAPGYPDASLFPWDELRAIAARVLDGHDPSVLQYGPTRGEAALVEALVPVQASRGITTTPANILVTTGSQQGIDLLARVCLDPGDIALVELPTYTGAISAFRNMGARVEGVRQDDGGIDLEDLDRVCARERAAGARVKLLYLTPNFQNPAGVLLDAARRAALVEWAARADVLVVEDDPYGTLYFDDALADAATRPVCAADDDGQVVYLSTFSKTLAPGFRVGWMVAPAELAERCEAVKQSVDLLTGTLDQRVVLEALREQLPARLAPSLRQAYRERLTVMEQALAEALGDDLTWTSPRGGFFLWARLPEDVDDETLLAHAMERGLIFVPGSAFFVNGAGHDRIRLSFSWARPEQIPLGARRLAEAVEACRGSRQRAHA